MIAMTSDDTSSPVAKTIQQTQRVKRLVREHLGVDCLISVQEALCVDHGCESATTNVRIVMPDFREITATIHKAASEVSPADVSCAL